MAVYALCDQNCKYETLTKEQIYALVAQAVETGVIGDCDTGFITTIKTINNVALKFFVGKQTEYNALSDSDKQGLFAIITDDPSASSITAIIDEFREQVTSLTDKVNGILGGTTKVPKAYSADSASRADNATSAITAITDSNGKTFTTDYAQVSKYTYYTDANTGEYLLNCPIGALLLCTKAVSTDFNPHFYKVGDIITNNYALMQRNVVGNMSGSIYPILSKGEENAGMARALGKWAIIGAISDTYIMQRVG